MKYCFGIDIGGTTVKMGLFQEDGELLDKWEIKTRTENQGEAILPDCAGSESKDGRKETGERTDHRTWNGASGTGNRGWNCSEYSKSRMGIQRSDT